MMSSELTLEMSALFNKLKEEMDKQTSTLTETITTNVLLSIDEKIKPIIQENMRLKNEVEILTKKVNRLELNARGNNIIIHGIPESNGESEEHLLDLAVTTIHDLDVNLEIGEVVKVQRLGKKLDNRKVRPILLATTTLRKKIEILRNKRKMPSNTYITQDLTKEELQRRQKKVRDTEKRKRNASASPEYSHINANEEKLEGNESDPKIKKINAFSYMRARSYSLSEKNTYIRP